MEGKEVGVLGRKWLKEYILGFRLEREEESLRKGRFKGYEMG